MSDLTDRIAAAIEECPMPVDGENWADVLAAAIVAELGLEMQSHYDPDCPFYRFVTDWINPTTGLTVDLP